MKKILALAVLLGTVAFATAAAMADDGARYLPVSQRQALVADRPQINSREVTNDGEFLYGRVSQKWVDPQGTHLIAVNGYPFAVQDEFWTQVRVGDTVQRIGGRWTIVAHDTPWNSGT